MNDKIWIGCVHQIQVSVVLLVPLFAIAYSQGLIHNVRIACHFPHQLRSHTAVRQDLLLEGVYQY